MDFWDGLKEFGMAHIPGYGAYRAADWLTDKTDRTQNQYSDIDRSNYDLPGFADRDAQYQDLAARYGQRVAPQARGADLGPYERSGQSGFRGDQQGLVGQLQRRASGEESLSKLQLADALGQNMRQQQALAASARPGQGGLANRTAAQQMAQLGSGLAGQQAMAGIQERHAAQGLLGNVLGQARGQDIAQNQFNAAQQNQRALELARLLQQNQQFNVGAHLQQQGLNQQGQLAALAQALQAAGMQQRGGMGYEGNRTARWQGMLGQPTQMERMMGLGGDIGSLLMML